MTIFNTCSLVYINYTVLEKMDSVQHTYCAMNYIISVNFLRESLNYFPQSEINWDTHSWHFKRLCCYAD
jgi:hypothetical protein